MKIINNKYCKTCDGTGSIEYADYDYDGNVSDFGITVECPDCSNKRDSLVDRLARFITTFDIDESICSKHCKLKNEENVDIYDCVDCIIDFFSKPCKWEQDEVCVNDKSEWCADFIDGVRCGRCKYYE